MVLSIIVGIILGLMFIQYFILLSILLENDKEVNKNLKIETKRKFIILLIPFMLYIILIIDFIRNLKDNFNELK